MKTYNIDPFMGAVLMTILAMGLVGLLIVLPVVGIQWGWNSLIVATCSLPRIDGWQAGLLYLAFGILVYISGLIKIEIHTGEID